MKNNDSGGNRETEKLLKEKMNALSSSVDCFDRISAKAFPEKNTDFSESGFVVCDVENITGRSHKTAFLKWTAVVAVFALCVAVIPKTRITDSIIAHFGKSPTKIYNEIIDEIDSEIEKNDYKIYDIPLDDCIKYDRLISPFFTCPFADCGKENINVRIFVRMYGDCPTNQVYAVEYSGRYEKSDFIAVADSRVKFEDSDFENISYYDADYDNSAVNQALTYNFRSEYGSYITDESGKKVSLGSFDYESIFKSDDGVYSVFSQMLYFSDSTGDGSESDFNYFYDVNNLLSENGTTENIEIVWNHSLRFDGFSAMPEKSNSLFQKKELFGEKKQESDSMYFAFIIPEIVVKEKESDITQSDIMECITDIYEMGYCYDDSSSVIQETCTLHVPYDFRTVSSFKMYFSEFVMLYSDSSEPSMMVTSRRTGGFEMYKIAESVAISSETGQ